MRSGIVLGRADPRPIYIQIMEQVRERIAVGDWAAGDALPSIRELASELRVSVITVKRAYLELEREKVIITRHGIGSSVADPPQRACPTAEDELNAEIDLLARHAAALGLSAAQLSARIVNAMRRATLEDA